MRNNELFEKHSVVLTLLSPIHIGCEDEYEPTNFVVDHSKKLLFFFDPSLVPLTIGQRDQLGNIAKSASISSISRFYNSHLDLFSAFASSVIPYDSIAGKTIENLLQGNDTSHDLHRFFFISDSLYSWQFFERRYSHGLS